MIPNLLAPHHTFAHCAMSLVRCTSCGMGAVGARAFDAVGKGNTALASSSVSRTLLASHDLVQGG